MSGFLKLSNIIINKNIIQHIDIKKDKFVIHLISNKIYGLFVFGSGTYQAYNTELEVCKIKHSSDYKAIVDWIDDLK
jgi:hypothetical protein